MSNSKTEEHTSETAVSTTSKSGAVFSTPSKNVIDRLKAFSLKKGGSYTNSFFATAEDNLLESFPGIATSVALAKRSESTTPRGCSSPLAVAADRPVKSENNLADLSAETKSPSL